MTLQEIADKLNESIHEDLRKHGFKVAWYDEEDDKLTIRICAIGNGYGYYGPHPKEIKLEEIDRKMFFEIVNNPKVKVLDCIDCWGCGDW